MRYTREEIHQRNPVKKEEGLTPKQREHLEETKRLHDKALRRLAQM